MDPNWIHLSILGVSKHWGPHDPSSLADREKPTGWEHPLFSFHAKLPRAVLCETAGGPAEVELSNWK